MEKCLDVRLGESKNQIGYVLWGRIGEVNHDWDQGVVGWDIELREVERTYNIFNISRTGVLLREFSSFDVHFTFSVSLLFFILYSISFAGLIGWVNRLAHSWFAPSLFMLPQFGEAHIHNINMLLYVPPTF